MKTHIHGHDFETKSQEIPICIGYIFTHWTLYRVLSNKIRVLTNFLRHFGGKPFRPQVEIQTRNKDVYIMYQ